MSDYRDDTNEIAVAGDETWVGTQHIAETTARLRPTPIYRLRVLHEGTAEVGDEALGAAGAALIETADLSEEWSDDLRAAVLVREQATVRDFIRGRLRVLHADTLSAGDEVLDRQGRLIADSAHITDEVIGQRRVAQWINESAKLHDRTMQAASVLVVDAARIEALLIEQPHVRSVIEEFAVASDAVLDAHRVDARLLIDAAHATSDVFDALHARQTVIESAEAGDHVMRDAGYVSQAWTANVRTWATSRYAPYTFTSVAVIGGVPYATRPDGVYALTGGEENIEAVLRTGKLDLGRGQLVHPLAAFMEYELDGVASMDVTTTQSGAAETYAYGLPPEQADELTNGRFSFGRGLRGRHFSFALRLSGRRGLINDLSVEMAPTKRRT